MKIETIETSFDKQTSGQVMHAIKSSMAARNKTASAQKAGRKVEMAEIQIDGVHIANVAIWTTANEPVEFFDFSIGAEFYGVPTPEFWGIWAVHKDVLKKRHVFVEKSGGEWAVGRYVK